MEKILMIQIMLEIHDDHFCLANGPDHPLSNIAYFLSDDVGMGRWILFFKNWILDPKQDMTGGNYCILEKKGDKVIIGQIFAEDEFEYSVTVSASSLYNLLIEWEKICKEMPDEFTITLDGYDLKVEITKHSR